IVSDAWSMSVLVRELGELYRAYSRGEESPLAEVELQYADYAVWQRKWLSGEELERQMGYWRERLKGGGGVGAGGGGGRGEAAAGAEAEGASGYRGGSVEVEMSKEVSEGVKRLSRRQGATEYMVMLAGLGVVLWRHSGQREVLVGSAIANRTRKETEGMQGF